jgi:predicted Fe-Mo cluster-binding NifX family protein
MRIAVSARGPALSSEIDPGFSRARYFVVVDTDTGELSPHDNSENVRAAQGAGAQTAQSIVTFGVEGLITGNIATDAATALKAGNVKVYKQTWGTVRDAVERFKTGRLLERGLANRQTARIERPCFAPQSMTGTIQSKAETKTTHR